MAHTYSKLLYHCIFSTKERRALITEAVRKRLYPYIGSIVRANKGSLLAIGGTADHVHLLIELRGALCVSDAMRLIKANSSKWIRETFPAHAGFGWQTGYGAFTVSASAVETAIAYIESQKHHHRAQTFEEEFVAFLNRHGMEHEVRNVEV